MLLCRSLRKELGHGGWHKGVCELVPMQESPPARASGMTKQDTIHLGSCRSPTARRAVEDCILFTLCLLRCKCVTL